MYYRTNKAPIKEILWTTMKSKTIPTGLFCTATQSRGGFHPSVPETPVVGLDFCQPSSRILLLPKSAIFQICLSVLPSIVYRMFAGLMSRCTVNKSTLYLTYTLVRTDIYFYKFLLTTPGFRT